MTYKYEHKWDLQKESRITEQIIKVQQEKTDANFLKYKREIHLASDFSIVMFNT